jgi:Outer membrane protein beta-barrel domain
MMSGARRRLQVVVIVICFCLYIVKEVCAQNVSGRRFHFGISGGVIASQIDGDALSGFNKFGYQIGLLGGYSFNEAHWFVLELQYGSYGSNKKNEDVEKNLESDMKSINVLLGYSLRFGDSWDGRRRFRFIVGPKLHRFIKVDGPNISKESLKNQFIAAHLGFSFVASKSILIDLTYTHSVMNLLNEPLMTTDTYVPYYLSLCMSYYVSK